MASITNNLNTGRTETFTYDAFNRISTAQTQATTGSGCWGLSYGYDLWANLQSATVTQCAAPPLSLGVSLQNRITNTGFSYDAAGNVLSDGTLSYTWDGEGRMKTAGSTSYVYDGDGKRVQKGTSKLYWYGMNADALAESDGAGSMTNEFIFFPDLRRSAPATKACNSSSNF